MKILYIINHMGWFWSHRLPLAQGAQQAGWQVDVACTGAGNDAQLAAQNFIGHDLPPGNVLNTIWATHKTIAITKPDLVHAITLKYAFITGLAALPYKPQTLVRGRVSDANYNAYTQHPHPNPPPQGGGDYEGPRLIFTLAGLGYLFSGEELKPKILRTLIWPFLKLALHRAQLIFQNPDDMALLIDRGLARKNQCHLIRGSGVDTTQFPFTPEPETDEPLVIMPTRLVREKGVAVFAEAARILKARGSTARFQIAGGISTSNPNAITEAEMRELTADGAVEWLGKVSDMPALFAASNLVVYPSYYREGIPKVLLEAAATGRAIITTDHPGCREAVTDGKNGLLVPVKNAKATADAMEKLLNDPDTRAKMGAESRKRAEEEFDVKRIVEETLAVYNAKTR